MKIFVTILFLLFLGPLPAYAQSEKVITLSDGSVIKGEVKSLVDGKYLVKSPSLGIIHIPEEDIQSISNPQLIPQNAQGISANPSALRLQTKGLERKLLSDPEILMDIQSIATDEEVLKMIADKNFLDAVMSMDEQRIMNNKTVQEFADNPRIRALMEKIKLKLNINETFDP
jgi:hypothetical protein